MAWAFLALVRDFLSLRIPSAESSSFSVKEEESGKRLLWLTEAAGSWHLTLVTHSKTAAMVSLLFWGHKGTGTP